MGNSRTSYYWIEGEQFLGTSVRFDIYFRTMDGPNGAGVLVDIIRAIKTARDKGIKGLESTICAFGFKSPPKRQKLSQAHEEFRQKYVSLWTKVKEPCSLGLVKEWSQRAAA